MEVPKISKIESTDQAILTYDSKPLLVENEVVIGSYSELEDRLNLLSNTSRITYSDEGHIRLYLTDGYITFIRKSISSIIQYSIHSFEVSDVMYGATFDDAGSIFKPMNYLARQEFVTKLLGDEYKYRFVYNEDIACFLSNLILEADRSKLEKLELHKLRAKGDLTDICIVNLEYPEQKAKEILVNDLPIHGIGQIDYCSTGPDGVKITSIDKNISDASSWFAHHGISSLFGYVLYFQNGSCIEFPYLKDKEDISLLNSFMKTRSLSSLVETETQNALDRIFIDYDALFDDFEDEDEDEDDFGAGEGDEGDFDDFAKEDSRPKKKRRSHDDDA